MIPTIFNFGINGTTSPPLIPALVTALGMRPLALASKVAGHEIEGPMAIVILGGLVTSNVPNLLVLPTLALITDPVNHPVFVHCDRGSDRTGIVIAAYRIKYEGWTVEQAYEEMKKYGARSILLFWWKNVLNEF